MICKTGSFTASGASQSVAHGLGATPTLVLLWHTGAADTNFKLNYDFAFGAYDRTTSRSFAAHRVHTSATSYTYTSDSSIVGFDSATSIALDGTISSVDGTNINITWAAVTGYVVHFIAFSGVSAKVGEFSRPGTPINKAVTGVGFRPDMGILFSTDSTALPVMNSTTAAFSFGVFNKHNEQHLVTQNIQATRCSFKVDACTGQTSGTSFAYSAHIESMDQDGFTLHYTACSDTAITFYVAINNVNSSIGVVAKTTGAATAAQVVTADTIVPKGEVLLMFSDGSSSAPGTVDSGEHFSWGFSDGTNYGSCSTSIAPFFHQSQSVERTTKNYVSDNGAPTASVASECSITSFDADGFTLSWTTNNALAHFLGYALIADKGSRTFSAT